MQLWTGNRCVVPQVTVADRFWLRFRGLMGKRSLAPHSGLLLTQCGSIHTCFMRFPIDVVYLSAEYAVLYTETVKPWRIGKLVRHVKHTLELPVGEKERFEIGQILEIKEESL